MRNTLLIAAIATLLSTATEQSSAGVIFEDRFGRQLADGWRWLRENPPNWRIREQALEIRVEPGVADTVKNALLRAAPDRSQGRYAIEVTVTNTAAPSNQYEQAGITWYCAGKPVFKLVKEFIDGALYIIPGKVRMDSRTVQLRLEVTADSFTAQFRPNAEGEFKTAASGPLPPPAEDEVSIQCYNGPADAEHWMRFADFRIVELESAASQPTGPSVDLPDDWQKTPVGPDGGLQYDPHGPAGFGTRIIPGVAGGMTDQVRQESHLPHEAFVRTVCRRYDMECVTEAFAAPPPAGTSQPVAQLGLTVTRVGTDTVLNGWAAASVPCDPAFADIAVGWNEPIIYRIRADRSTRYTVIFGLCEGHHTRSAQRPLDLKLEGQTRKTVDLLAEKGRNVPVAYAFEATDENGDGWIDASVAPVAGAPDTNAILNVLWVFPVGRIPPLDEVIAGRHNATALTYVPCGSGPPPAPRDDMLILRLRSPQGLDVTTVPTLTIESDQAVQVDPEHKWARIGVRTTVACAEPFERVDHYPGRTLLVYGSTKVPAGGEKVLAFGVHRGPGEGHVPALLQKPDLVPGGK